MLYNINIEIQEISFNNYKIILRATNKIFYHNLDYIEKESTDISEIYIKDLIKTLILMNNDTENKIKAKNNIKSIEYDTTLNDFVKGEL
jgi:hypothetical protein